MYKNYLEDPENKSVLDKLREMEDSLNVTNILIAREQAKLEVRKVYSKCSRLRFIVGEQVKIDSL